jgi:hypothetical protein
MVAKGWLVHTMPLRATTVERFWFLLPRSPPWIGGLPEDCTPAWHVRWKGREINVADPMPPRNWRNLRRCIGHSILQKSNDCL